MHTYEIYINQKLTIESLFKDINTLENNTDCYVNYL